MIMPRLEDFLVKLLVSKTPEPNPADFTTQETGISAALRQMRTIGLSQDYGNPRFDILREQVVLAMKSYTEGRYNKYFYKKLKDADREMASFLGHDVDDF